tara:strand:+ start:194 stop:463 length:270 start_codon:yes stop_codon:yes gene_type:complete
VLTDEELDERIRISVGPSMGGFEIGTIYGDTTSEVARWAYAKACDDCAKRISTRKVEEDNTDRFNAYCHAQDDCLSLKTKTLDSGGSDD